MPAPPLTPLDEALDIITRQVEPLPQVQAPLPALGLTLGEDILADSDQPPFDRSAMDGFAVAGEGDTFRVIGEIQPGDAPSLALKAGEAVRLFTGSQIPDGAIRVVMQEHVERQADGIRVTQTSENDHIRRRGEDAKAGQVLVPQGKTVSPAIAAIMASVGQTRVRATPKPRVLHLATGNELVAPDKTPAPNQIRDSNSTLMACLLQQDGLPLAQQERVKDDLAASHEFCRQQEATYDALLVSGGASVGSYDFGKPLLEQLGYSLHFSQLDLRPGKPLLFATKREDGRQKLAFVLPGNPVSHFVCYHVLVRVALLAMAGQSGDLATVRATLDGGFTYRPAPRLTFWPARLHRRWQKWFVQALPWQSSGDLTSLARANALIRIRSKESVIPHGRELDVVLLDPGYQDVILKGNNHV